MGIQNKMMLSVGYAPVNSGFLYGEGGVFAVAQVFQ